MRYLKAFGQFWYEFIIGDDYKIAVAVVAALLMSLALMTWTELTDGALTVIGALLVMGCFSVSLVIDTRSGD
jgi:hypothetical protein